ncbi:MAG: polysaccharide pyruvyl transferase family protein [Candidatus Peregrinibacteria bacterium]|nr:polysaccharide pyruvyl transferase family protein [Candidatus Peregrinibacteria bacterium]MDZ4244756.1 polysaccharide pyruvyl transferase family protein [Candidatus Gracilibacteria bacterium]
MGNYIVCGNYGANNIGDEAILEGLLYVLKQSDSDAKFIVMSGNPEETKDIHGVEAVKFFPSGLRSLLNFATIKATLNAYKKSDTFVLGGGGLFTDHSSLKAVWIWFIQTLLAKIYGKKIVMIGQSVGPLDSKIARFITKTVFSWASSISVRDESSKKVLSDIGVNLEVEMRGDLAMNLTEIYKDILLEKKTAQLDQKTYSVVNLKYIGRTNNVYEQEVVKFIEFLINQSTQEVYLKPFGAGQISDEKYLNKLIVQYNLDKNKVHVHTDYSLKGTLKLLTNAEFVLGMRLHSLILSRVCRVPFIGLNYHDKVRDYFKNSSQILDLDKITYEKLRSCYEEVIKDK